MARLGKVLKEIRESKNISQQELAYGICTREYIYKIEKGINVPTVYILKQLVVKLNEDLNRILELSNYEYPHDVLKFIKQIDYYRMNLKYNELNDYILNLEDHIDFCYGINYQYLLFNKAIIALEIGKDIDKSYNLLLEALNITKHLKSVDEIINNNIIFTDLEILIITYISKILYFNNKIYLSIKLLEKIYNQTKNNNDYILHIKALYNLAYFYNEIKEYKKALIYLDEDIAFCKNNMCMHLIGEIMYLKAKILYSENKFEDAKKLLKDAITIFKINEKYEYINMIKNKYEVNIPI